MKKELRKIRLHKETLRHMGEDGLGRVAGASDQKVCASEGSDCAWTCPYSDCHFTACFCNSGFVSQCTC